MDMTESRVVLVTGGNRGLGLEFCRQLAARGDTVLLGSRDPAKGEAAASGIEGGSVHVIPLDMSQTESFAAVASRIDGEFGKLDVLVNNAAVLNDLNIHPTQTDETTLRLNFDVNFFGPYMLTQAMIPLLRKSAAPRVLNLATQVGSFTVISDPDSPLKDDISPAYQSSKIALNAMTALFAKELAPDGIAVNSACPGWVMTDMGHDDLPDYGDSVRPMSASEAVDKMLWLIDEGPDGPTGGFFSEGHTVGW